MNPITFSVIGGENNVNLFLDVNQGKESIRFPILSLFEVGSKFPLRSPDGKNFIIQIDTKTESMISFRVIFDEDQLHFVAFFGIKNDGLQTSTFCPKLDMPVAESIEKAVVSEPISNASNSELIELTHELVSSVNNSNAIPASGTGKHYEANKKRREKQKALKVKVDYIDKSIHEVSSVIEQNVDYVENDTDEGSTTLDVDDNYSADNRSSITTEFKWKSKSLSFGPGPTSEQLSELRKLQERTKSGLTEGFNSNKIPHIKFPDRNDKNDEFLYGKLKSFCIDFFKSNYSKIKDLINSSNRKTIMYEFEKNTQYDKFYLVDNKAWKYWNENGFDVIPEGFLQQVIELNINDLFNFSDENSLIVVFSQYNIDSSPCLTNDNDIIKSKFRAVRSLYNIEFDRLLWVSKEIFQEKMNNNMCGTFDLYGEISCFFFEEQDDANLWFSKVCNFEKLFDLVNEALKDAKINAEIFSGKGKGNPSKICIYH